MSQKQNLEVKLEFKTDFFYIGEPIKGNLLLKSERPSIIEKIVAEIRVAQSWKINSDNPLVLYGQIGDYELDLSQAPSLNSIQGCYVMPGGENNIPINLKISNDLAPSFEYPVGEKFAHIRYSFNIRIFSTSFENTFFPFNLTLFSRPSIDNKKKLLNKSVSKTLKKWGMFNIGTTILTCSIPENNFKYDDSSCKVIIHIDNTNGRAATKEARIKFIRKIEFLNKENEIKFKENNLIFSRNLAAHVDPGQKNYFDCLISLKANDINKYNFIPINKCPYKLNMSEINFYMPTIYSSLIICKYELSISLNYECHVSESTLPNIVFPIFMVHQSPMEYQIELQKKEMEKKMNIINEVNFNGDNIHINNINNINNIFNNNNNVNNKINIIKNNNNYISNEVENQIEAPPSKKIKIIDIDSNINKNDNLSNINIINNDDEKKFFTNDGNDSNIINNRNNINYNFNININNNLENSLNNNYNSNYINNLNNNIIKKKKKKKSIKESSFSLFDNFNNPDNQITPAPVPANFMDINTI